MFSKYNYDFNDKIEKASNLLVRILLGDIQLSKYFRSAIDINNVKDFIALKGQYGNLLLDSKSGKYVLFINAFNTMFKIYKKEFLNYFNKMLFSNFMNKKNLMDILSTIDINEMININTFVELLENIYYRDIYECTRMVGHNIITHHLQIENNNLLYDEKKYGYKEYLIDLSQISDFKAIYEIEDIYLEQTKLIINRYTEISNL
ncbi:hypothetical protein [Macrococcoides bohemicum]|uniref:hypothetical protein n=1 Tax=Macrococcoides bohemicum TaxID=1903056 RepID=UPI00165EA512|nr:hypothetical protein [Macrococcus bohemicus]MBC9873472.1 hypothetical protein [Macrococcus bohemicus]